MSKILLKTRGTQLSLEGPARLVGTQVEYNICKFDFGPEWAGFVKTAVFKTGDRTINMVIDGENKCAVPWESVAERGILYLGVFGVKDNTVIPTNFVALNIIEGSAKGDYVPAPPTLDVYMQIMNELSNTRDYIDNVEMVVESKEQARQDEYTEAEEDRYNRYSRAEANRNSQYNEAEEARYSSYQDIKSQIVQNENERIESEETRQENENARAEFENIRRENENSRIDAEVTRTENEGLRMNAEEQRNTAETERKNNETSRVNAEDARSVFEKYNPSKQYRVGNKVVYQGSSYRCISNCRGVPPAVGDNWMLVARKGDVYFPTFSVDEGMNLIMHDDFNYDGTISFKLENGCLIQEVI